MSVSQYVKPGTPRPILTASESEWELGGHQGCGDLTTSGKAHVGLKLSGQCGPGDPQGTSEGRGPGLQCGLACQGQETSEPVSLSVAGASRCGPG